MTDMDVFFAASEWERCGSGQPGVFSRSASTLAAVQEPDDDADGEQKHRKDEQRERTTHRSKKRNGRLYTHRPGEDIMMSLPTRSV